MIDPLQLRNTLGLFPTGVCLITARDEQGQGMALTANSFSSVSLDPPLVQWSIQRTSDAYEGFVNAPRFAINVLRREQEALSTRYARRGEHVITESHFRPGENGAPILAFFECGLHQTVEAGDHTIIIGRVTHFERHADSAPPLVFFSGGYRELKP